MIGQPARRGRRRATQIHPRTTISRAPRQPRNASDKIVAPPRTLSKRRAASAGAHGLPPRRSLRRRRSHTRKSENRRRGGKGARASQPRSPRSERPRRRRSTREAGRSVRDGDVRESRATQFRRARSGPHSEATPRKSVAAPWRRPRRVREGCVRRAHERRRGDGLRDGRVASRGGVGGEGRRDGGALARVGRVRHGVPMRS